MSRISAGEAYVSISCDNKNLLAGLREAGQKIQETSRTFSAAGSSLNPSLNVGGADAFRSALREVRREAEQTANAAKKLSDRFVITAGDVWHAFSGMARGLSSLLGGVGDQFDKMTLRTGLSTQALSEYAHAAEMCGASISDVEGAMRSMAAQLVAAQNGSSRAQKAFSILGLSVDAIAGRSPEEQFDAIARAISSIEDPTQRAGAALKIFGSAGTSLLPLFAQGPDGLAKLREEARALGVSIDSETATLGANFTDSMTRLRAAVQGLGLAISKLLTPYLVELANAAARTLAQIGALAERHPVLTKTILATAAAVAGLTSAVFLSGKAWGAMTGAMTTAMRVLTGLKAAVLANPWLALAAAITGAVAAIAAYKSAMSNVPKLETDAKDALEAGEAAAAQARADLERLKTLEDISKRQRLSNSEVSEAARLAESLRQSYGDLGISVDAVAGKISGATAAQDKLNAKILEGRKQQLQAAINEARTNESTGAIEMDIAKNSVSDWDAIIGKKYGQSWKDYFTSFDAYGSTDELKLAMVQDDPKFKARVKAAKDKNRAQIATWQAELDALNASTQRTAEQTAEAAAPDASAVVTMGASVADFIDAGTEEERSALDRKIDQIKRKREELIQELRRLADPSGEVDWTNADEVDKLFASSPAAAQYQQQALQVDTSAQRQIQQAQAEEARRQQAEQARLAEKQRAEAEAAAKKKADDDKQLADAQQKYWERHAAPQEKLAAAAVELQTAMRELVEAQRGQDSATIAAALNKLGEAEDKYASLEEAVNATSEAIGHSVGGTFSAWQASSIAAVDFDKQSLREAKTQTGFLRQIAQNTRSHGAAVFA